MLLFIISTYCCYVSINLISLPPESWVGNNRHIGKRQWKCKRDIKIFSLDTEKL